MAVLVGSRFRIMLSDRRPIVLAYPIPATDRDWLGG